MYCQTCGAQVPGDQRFCTNCGRPVEAGPPPPPPPMPTVPQPWTPPVQIKAQGGRWITEGWELVKADMGNFALLTLVAVVLNSVVPLVLQGPLFAGLHIVCIKKLFQRKTDFNDLFKGFNYFLPLLLATLV